MAHCISQRRDGELSAGNTLVSKVAGLPTFNLKGRRRVLLQARFATFTKTRHLPQTARRWDRNDKRQQPPGQLRRRWREWSHADSCAV